jgi:2-amino-4-hydroxy-6-hydroxymethyldihydropteridine diphosphokinase
VSLTRAAVALGSNLGDRAATLHSALATIAQLGEVVAVSGFHETAPVGGPEQGDFLNAVVVIDTTLGPEKLLAGLQRIEDGHGRVRVERWGPRTLDLDLVAMDGVRRDTPELTIPHPRAADRRFVLVPLVEVWPDAEVAPGITASQALAALGNSSD